MSHTQHPSNGQIARGQGREALCRALVRVVARDGFDGVTFRSVAAEAGVTHGLASYHFGKRETMIHEALTWAVEHTLESTRLVASPGGVDGFAADVSGAIAEHPENAIFQYEVLLRALRSPELRDAVRKSYDDYVDTVAEALAVAGIHDRALARLVFATLDGLTLQQLLYDDRRRVEGMLGTLRSLLALVAAQAPTGRAAPM